MNRFLLIAIGIILLAVAIPGVLASPFDLKTIDPVTSAQFWLGNPIRACPGPFASPENIKVFITNLGGHSDTYSISLVLPQGWSGQIANEAMLGPGEIKELDFSVNQNPLEVVPGNYSFTINVQSLSDKSDRTSRLIPIEILTCSLIDLNMQNRSIEGCVEDQRPVQTVATVTNKGKNTDTINLTALQGGEQTSLAAFSENSIALLPGQSKTVGIIINANTTMKAAMDIVAQSQAPWASDRETLSLNIKDCYSFNSTLVPESVSSCSIQPAGFNLTIRNIGKADTFKIFTPDNTGYNLQIPENSSRSIPITITPRQSGALKFNVTVASTAEPASVQTSTATINSNDCKGVLLSVLPAQNKICAGQQAGYSVTVKNTGTAQDTFTLSTTLGTLSKQKATLNQGASEAVSLTVDTKNLSGNKTITVAATAGNLSDAKDVLIEVVPCWSAELSVSPEQLSVKPCSNTTVSITLKNTGQSADNYSLSFLNTTQQIFLKPNETRTTDLALSILCSASGTFEIPITAKSAHKELQAKAVLNIGPQTSAENSTGSAGTTTTANQSGTGQSNVFQAEPGNSTTSPFTVKGKDNGTVAFSVLGPDWILVSPARMNITAGEEKTAYIVLMPKADTQTGAYLASIITQSGNSSEKRDIVVTVSTKGSAQPANGTANQTAGNQSLIDRFTGSFLGATVSWKAALLAVITLAIIIILGVRFAMLVKR